MNFIQTNITGSDCTAPFDVVEYKSNIVLDFINEMLLQCNRDFGYIEFYLGDRPFSNFLYYKHGKLIDEIPQEIKYLKFSRVISSGGWYRMDYRIYL